VNQFLQHLVTEDNEAKIGDYARVLSLVGGIVLTGMGIYQFWLDPLHFSIPAFGIAMMQYLIGCAALIAGKTWSGA
jgi:hypothetical protein